MKRLISGTEAVQAGLFPCVIDYGPAGGRWRVSREVAAANPMVNQDAYRLWRSSPGYRKACRMLRRSGRRIRNGPEMGVQAYQSVLDDPAAMAFAAGSAYALPSYVGVDYGTRPDEAWLITGQRVGQIVHVVNLEKTKE